MDLEEIASLQSYSIQADYNEIDIDADEELSDADEGKKLSGRGGLFFDSNDDQPHLGGCHSLPATPPRRRRRNQTNSGGLVQKECASENELGQKDEEKKNRMRRRSRRIMRERFLERAAIGTEDDSEGVVMLRRIKTRPRGGGRCLYMNSEEVKACKDLGFELEGEGEEEDHRHDYYCPLQRIITSRLSGQHSTSTPDTSSCCSGGNSPINNWRISSPGDDPRDVKARLKVWAQAVALASTSPRLLTNYGGRGASSL